MFLSSSLRLKHLKKSNFIGSSRNYYLLNHFNVSILVKSLLKLHDVCTFKHIISDICLWLREKHCVRVIIVTS
jgi:hypothetical protein